jgi:Ion transport protein
MMIFEIMADLRTFLLILATVLCGFANAFFVILRKAPFNSYSTPYTAIRSSFSYMLGGYDLEELDASPTPIMLSILWAAFMMIVSIVLLNVLIAIISDSYERLTALEVANFRLEKAKLTLSSYKMLSKKHKKQLADYLKHRPYLAVLKATALLESETSNEWNGKVGAIVKQVRAAVNCDNATLKSDISSVKADVASMKADMTSMRSTARSDTDCTQLTNLDSVVERVAALSIGVDKTNELLAHLINKVGNVEHLFKKNLLN